MRRIVGRVVGLPQLLADELQDLWRGLAAGLGVPAEARVALTEERTPATSTTSGPSRTVALGCRATAACTSRLSWLPRIQT